MAPQRRKSPVPARGRSARPPRVRSVRAPAPRDARPRGRQDAPAVRRAVADLIRALGLDPAAEPELRQTPERVAGLYAEIFAGLEPGAEPTPVTFPLAGGGLRAGRRVRDLVTVRDLPFHSLCVHHFVPFFGTAHVAYLPGRRLIGLSGIARVLEFYARRPQLQERLTAQLADHLMRLLGARGVAVVLEGRHLCMEMRGVRKSGVFETRALRGELAQPRWAGLPALGSPRAGHGPAGGRRTGTRPRPGSRA